MFNLHVIFSQITYLSICKNLQNAHLNQIKTQKIENFAVFLQNSIFMQENHAFKKLSAMGKVHIMTTSHEFY